MKNFKTTQLYDGFENDELYNTQIETGLSLADILRTPLDENSVKEQYPSFYEYVCEECKRLYVSEYFFSQNNAIIAIGFGETQPARYQLFRFNF